METVTDLFSWAPKSLWTVTSSHEIKRCLLLGKKAMTNLDSILKSRDVTLLTEVHLVKAMVFPVVMYRCESWTIKKAEHWRIDAFELWCWRRLSRVPWTAGRPDQSILKEISPEYSLEGMMLKLKLQYFEHLMKSGFLEKTLMLENIEGRRRREQQKMRWWDDITDVMDVRVGLWRRLSAKELNCFWTVVLEKTWESLDCKEIQPVNPKGNWPWIFTGRTDAEAEAPILWPPDAKSRLIGKDLGAGKDWRQQEKGTTEDEMVGWHHRLNGREFEQAPGDGEGQGSQTCYSPWVHKESDTTEWLNNKMLALACFFWLT